MSELISGEDLFQWRQGALHLAQAHSVDLEEVDWLLQGVTSLSSLSLRLGDYREHPSLLIKADLTNLTAKWQQRIHQRVPVQYLAGETPWRNFSMVVSPAVLIPRPETELIIDIAQALVAQNPVAAQLQQGHWADIGTGSGAIALGLAQQFPTAAIHANDISAAALVIAQLNAQQNQLAERITFYQGSWLSPLTSLSGQLSAIISNPPYIPTHTVGTLQLEVTNHEPHLALDGGPDGLNCIRTLIKQGATYLSPNGIWLIELMATQADTVADLLSQQGSYTHIAIHKDLAAVERFVSARKAL